MKPPGTPSNATLEPDDRDWYVEFTLRAARVTRKFGFDDSDFNPTLAAVVAALEEDPKQFPKLKGKLASLRAAPMRYRGKNWGVPFALDESLRIVTVLTIEPIEEAYRTASR
jgi:hypothetical protein